MSNPIQRDPVSESDIAVIGLAGRFPRAGSIDQFWANLRDGVEAISFFSAQELIDAGIDPALVAQPGFVKAGGVLDDVELFDATFFGFNPREAEIMDPQHRAFLEVAWEALEHAGYNSATYGGAIGVYGGVSPGTYLMNNLMANASLAESVNPFQLKLSNDKDFLPTMTSYKLDLRGPSMAVQTACSTSLTAICLASQSLLTYQCDIALAGGVSIKVPHKAGYLYQEGGILSPDGHCRSFDAGAGGSVDGNGVGIVVLKRLAEALEDGDYIHAVIKGTAINNDGAIKVNYTAPSVDGQAEVISMAQAVAGVDASSISYIEAHGAGTLLGDPIEVAALTQAFRANTEAKSFCAIGSVKSNIGHLDTAAGVSGLIKTVLALRHKQIPPSLHYRRPNPQIDFENSPFYVNTKLTEWQTDQLPRRAGVSSFGIGGTNAHVVLEEAPALEPSDPPRPWQLLVLSAKTAPALQQATQRLATHLQQHPDDNLADIAYTLQVGRRAFDHRQILVCRDAADAIAALEASQPDRVVQRVSETRDWPVAFLFAGLGDHYRNMGLSLYQTEPVFREELDRCAELLEPELGLDLRTVLYPNGTAQQPDAEADGNGSGHKYDLRRMFNRGTPTPDASADQLNQTVLAQPILFALEYALAQQWLHWGVQPQALLGHSLGEYVAATLAGVFAIEDALRVVAARARLIQELPAGGMLTVLLSEQAIQPYLGRNLSLAAVNGPQVCVVAGTNDAIDGLEQQLLDQGIACRRLPTSHAFHSHLMEPILEPFTEVVRGVTLNAPEIPFVSNVTGTWITAAQATDPRYWARHTRQTVRFADGAKVLWNEPGRILVEVGPGQSLSSMALQQPKQPNAPERLALPTLRTAQDPTPDRAITLSTLGKLWLAGATIDWERLYSDERRQRLPLPTYPFERKRYWVSPQRAAFTQPTRPLLSGKQPSAADWFYTPLWKQSIRPTLNPPTLATTPQCWLILGGSDPLSTTLCEQLTRAGHTVVLANAGDHFSQHAADSFTIDPQRHDDYDQLLRRLSEQDRRPYRIVHLWTAAAPIQQPEPQASVASLPPSGATSLLALAHALHTHAHNDPLDLWVVAAGLYQIESSDEVEPEQATILGPCRVIEHEYTHISCRVIDVTRPATARHSQRLAQQLVAEFTTPAPDPIVAYRGQLRWTRMVEHVALATVPAHQERLRDGGTYLITHGLTQPGLALAEYLAQSVRARLLVLSTTALPPSAEWDAWLDSHDAHDSTSQTIRRLQALVEAGAELHLVAVETQHSDALQGAIRQQIARWGGLDAIFAVMAEPPAETLMPIAELDNAAYRQHVQAGINELEAISRAIQDGGAQLCIVQSSLAAVLGGAAVVVAATADSFARAFVQQQATVQPIPWINLRWNLQLSGADRPDVLSEVAITLAEGSTVLRQATAVPGGTTLIVSAEELEARLSRRGSPPAGSSAVDQDAQDANIQHNGQPAPREPRNSQERAMAEIWRKLLGVEQISIYDSFFDLGGHSLLAPQLLGKVRDAFEVELPLSILFEFPTVAGLTEIIARVQHEGAEAVFPAAAGLDLRSEAVLDPSIDATDLPPATLEEPAAILLTGATGFLGAFLLRELLDRTRAQVHCLVRATNAQDGKKRLERNLAAYGLWDEALAPRISAVVGDLAQPLWGLTEQQFRQLAGRIDAIYHCGAWVNFTYPYSALKPSNVQGLQETLRLASQIKVKPVHYISSVAVFSPAPYGAEHLIMEDRPLDYAEGFFSGYAETKWVAEQLIATARERGIPATIYRPGVIGGHSQSGIGNTKDLIWNIMKGCIQLGVVPDVDQLPDLDTMIDVAPVDYVSQAIVHLSRQPDSIGKVFHLPNPQRLHWSQVADFIRGFGYPLREVSAEEWRATLVDVVSRDPDNALYPFLPVLVGADSSANDQTPHIATDLVFDCRNTLAGLANSSIVCPPIDARLLATYFEVFIQSSFLPTPSQAQPVSSADE